LISSKDTPQNLDPPIPGTGHGKLYVFIHGMICLVEGNTKFLGLVVDLGNDHSYRLGDWLVEVPMTRNARMKLTGVKAGTGGFDYSKVTVIERPFDTATKPFAVIELPKPVAPVRSLRRTVASTDLVSGPGAAFLKQTGDGTFTVAALHILEYDFDELSDVALDDGSWGPPTLFRETRVATLHFFAEPEQLRPVKHNLDEFHKAASLFTGVDISITSPVTMAKLEMSEYPADVSSNEALSLIERRFLLMALAAGYKEGVPGDLPPSSEGGSGGVLCAPFVGRSSGL
jgi:hypothetical protein